MSEVIVMTDAEWRAAAEARLAEIGMTYAELMAKNADGYDLPPAERRLFTLIAHTLDDDLPDEAPVLAAAAKRPRRFRRI